MVGGRSFSWASIFPRTTRGSACSALPSSSKERARSRQGWQKGLREGGWERRVDENMFSFPI